MACRDPAKGAGDIHPLISIVIPTKNSLPHLKHAIEAIRRQTYRNFELLIQDGVSTDGTLEYLHSIDDLPLEIVSQPDSGIGQAYHRGIARSRGDFLCLSASDETLFPNSLQMGIDWFRQHPAAAAIYGSMSLVDPHGRELSTFIPEPFDFRKFMRCDLFPTFAGLFNRKVIGKDLYYDETLKTCPDYDFWLRLGSRFSSQELQHRTDLFSTARADRTSMTYRAESYEQFCRDKFFILERFLSSRTPSPDIERRAKAGILSWALRQVMHLEGISPLAMRLFERFKEQDNSPPPDTIPIDGTSTLTLLNRPTRLIFPWRRNVIKGGNNPWMYLAQATLRPPNNHSHWVRIRMKVSSGAVGVCLMNGDKIEQEKIFLPHPKEITTYFLIPSATSIIFRNGGMPHCVAKINELTLLKAKT